MESLVSVKSPLSSSHSPSSIAFNIANTTSERQAAVTVILRGSNDWFEWIRREPTLVTDNPDANSARRRTPGQHQPRAAPAKPHPQRVTDGSPE